jgi:RND family efflux transporter MFP subunit
MKKPAYTASLVVLVILMLAPALGAQQAGKGGRAAPPGPPPALVVVKDITRGDVEPMSEYVGTVYYSHVSDVASEVGGRVEAVEFDEGMRVKRGQRLAALSTDLLDEDIKATRASHEETLAELEKAQRDLRRVEALYKEDSIAEAVYDEHVFRAKGLEKRALSLEAALNRLLLEKEKKAIYSPFGGVVVEKSVEKGEWVSPGGKVGVVANDSELDVLVDVPGDILGYLEKSRAVDIKAGGRDLKARFLSVVPRGDVATRTFTVKLRLSNPGFLFEGMEARAVLPTGRKSSGILVPRDAVVSQFGMNVIFTVTDSTAKMVPVKVTGYKGAEAGVEGPGLEAGMKVVVKGNERLRDGQPVRLEGK